MRFVGGLGIMARLVNELRSHSVFQLQVLPCSICLSCHAHMLVSPDFPEGGYSKSNENQCCCSGLGCSGFGFGLGFRVEGLSLGFRGLGFRV